VLDAAEARAAALVARDADALRDLLHPRLRWTTFRGEVLDRQAYVAANTGGGLRWLGQRLEEVEIVVAGDAAVLGAVVLDEVERGGTPLSFRLRLTQTWTREDGRWLCLAGHAGPEVPQGAALH
jgi:ketosteroid isomerase-like protein